MIFDTLKNSGRYPEIPHLNEIAAFVQERDCTQLSDGELEILGRDLFVRIAEYFPEPADTKKFEAHQIYADFQLVVKGQEIIQYSSESDPIPATAYDKHADIQFFEDPKNISSLVVDSGEYVIFFPGELHRPGCPVDASQSKVKKLVFKIKMAAEFSER
ncbi:MAG: DUF386 domain-containing protein [Candidatus Omnitrophica bacterium]|nr:DUF386 domain-containing protein [Candidatus Omnitrophota bacterium]